jgi:putative redox protein
MQARVKWVEGLTFLGESASGHQILMDGNSGDKAPSPMEMVLMAAGGHRCGFYPAKRASGCGRL